MSLLCYSRYMIGNLIALTWIVPISGAVALALTSAFGEIRLHRTQSLCLLSCSCFSVDLSLNFYNESEINSEENTKWGCLYKIKDTDLRWSHLLTNYITQTLFYLFVYFSYFTHCEESLQWKQLENRSWSVRKWNWTSSSSMYWKWCNVSTWWNLY